MPLMQRIPQITPGAKKPFVRIPKAFFFVSVEEGSVRPG